MSDFTTENEKYSAIRDRFWAGFRPPPVYTLTEWADKYRKIPGVTGDEWGQWRTSRFPFLGEIQNCLSPTSPHRLITFMKGSQVGGTEVGINWALSVIADTPGPMGIVQPTVEMGKAYSKIKLGPSIAACEKTNSIVIDNRSRAQGNTMLQKDFPGGMIRVMGANSAAGLRMFSLKYGHADEIDAWPEDVDGEGDPLELFLKRFTNFKNHKIFLSSTPTIEDHSRIEYYFLRSDQRYFLIPCLYCGFEQIIIFKNIDYKNYSQDFPHLICQNCHKGIPEHNKTAFLAAGNWKAHQPDSPDPGFHLSSLYSPLGFYSWKDAVQKHLQSLTDPKKRQVWVNTVNAETWKVKTDSTVESGYLMKRREEYTAEVPAGVMVLTAFTDTQDDRLECSVWGFGRDDESWLIRHDKFYGDTSKNQIWEEVLDVHLDRKFIHASGQEMKIGLSLIDAMGHRTDKVYMFCLSRKLRMIFASRGEAGGGKPSVVRVGKSKEYGNYVFHLGVDGIKSQVYNNLKIEEPGPGYIHFPMSADLNYFNQLTAEELKVATKTGLPKFMWILPPGRRNEALDCAVGARGALAILNPNLATRAEKGLLYTGMAAPAPQRAAPPARRLSRGVEF